MQISSTRLRFGNHLVEDTPKSRAGRRTLPIPDHLPPRCAPLGPSRQPTSCTRRGVSGERLRRRERLGTALSPHALTSGGPACSRPPRPPYPVPRCSPHLRHANASADRSHCTHLAWLGHGRSVHDADVRALATWALSVAAQASAAAFAPRKDRSSL